MTSPGHVRTEDLTPGQRQTLAARRKRKRDKHLRWAAELAVAGWWVAEAGPITVTAWDLGGYAGFGLFCARCGGKSPRLFAEWEDHSVPLPEVLAKVNGHVCEATK